MAWMEQKLVGRRRKERVTEGTVVRERGGKGAQQQQDDNKDRQGGMHSGTRANRMSSQEAHLTQMPLPMQTRTRLQAQFFISIAKINLERSFFYRKISCSDYGRKK